MIILQWNKNEIEDGTIEFIWVWLGEDYVKA